MDTEIVKREMTAKRLIIEGWCFHTIALPDTPQIREQITWCRDTWGDEYDGATNPDGIWYSFPTKNSGGLIDGVVYVFHNERDKTYFLLRWA